MKKYKNEVILGLFALVGMIILGYLTLSIGKFQFGKVINVKAVFDSASGIVKDSSVMVAGVEVGRIKNIALENNKAVLTITINQGIKLSKNTTAIIRSKSLLGEKYVEFVPTGNQSFLENGDEIRKTITPVEIDQLVTSIAPIIIKLKPALEKINPDDLAESVKTLSVILKGKEKNISNIIKNVDELLSFVNNNKEKLNEIISNIDLLSKETRDIITDNKNQINRIVNNTDKIMGSFGQSSDKLAQKIDIITDNLLILSNDLNKKAPGIISKVDLITTDLKEISNDVKKNSPETLKRIGNLTKNLDNFLESLNKESPELSKELASLIKDLSKISSELSEKNPKMINNTDEVLTKLLLTLQRLEPLMIKIEKFDEKEIAKELERVMRQVGIRVHLF